VTTAELEALTGVALAQPSWARCWPQPPTASICRASMITRHRRSPHRIAWPTRVSVKNDE